MMKFSQYCEDLFKSSALDELLSRENLTLRDILDCEEIVSSAKMDGGKLFQFLSQHVEMIEEMLDYVVAPELTSLPEDPEETQRRYKFPFVVSELLSNELAGFNDYLFGFYTEQSFLKSAKKKKQSEEDEEEEEDNNNAFSSLSNHFAQNNLKVVEQTANSTEKLTLSVVGKEQVPQESLISPSKLNFFSQEADEDDEFDEVEGSCKHSKTVQLHQGFGNNNNHAKKKTNNHFGQQEDDDEVDLKEHGPKMLERLMSFLEQEEPINETSAGYFSKAMNSIVSNSKEGRFWKYLKGNLHVVDNLMRHFYNPSLAQIALKLLVHEAIELGEGEPDRFKLNRQKLLERVVETLAETEDEEVMDNIAQIFQEISEKYLAPVPDSEVPRAILLNLANHALKEECLGQLLGKLQQNSGPSRVFTLQILDNMIKILLRVEQKKLINNNNHSSQLEVEVDAQAYEEQINKIYHGAIQVLFQDDGERIGVHRISGLNLVRSLLQLKVEKNYQEVAKTKLFAQLINLAAKYPTSNIGHTAVEKIFLLSIDSQNEILLRSMVEECNVFKIINQVIIMQREKFDKHAITNGNKKLDEVQLQVQFNSFNPLSGMITNIGNQLQDLSKNLPFLQEILAKNEHWQQFCEQYLNLSIKIKYIQVGYYLNQNGDQSAEEFCFKISPEKLTHSKTTYEDGSVFEGKLVDGKKEGHGILTLSDENRYEGEFKNGKFDGFGTFSWKQSGRVFKGNYQNGKRKHGRFYFPGNIEYVGEFDDKGFFHGEITIIKNGVSREQLFDHGERLKMQENGQQEQDSEADLIKLEQELRELQQSGASLDHHNSLEAV